MAELSNFDMSAFGFDMEEFETGVSDDVFEESIKSLSDRFIVPPFSVLDTRQGYWQDRKDAWKQIIKSGNGRDDGLISSGLKGLAEMKGANLSGTSIFDPVLCEVLYNWFCPSGGKVIDPFSGGSVRGLIASMLGNEYTGVDLRERQIEANNENFDSLNWKIDLSGNLLKKPNWICGDSSDIDSLVSGEFDFLLTCPPYADLEVYSDDERDISNMNYTDFIKTLGDIVRKSTAMLKENAYAAIVVGEVRDKKTGYYRDFVGDTVRAFESAGLKYYNSMILVESGATASLRANRQFSASRKVVKTQQKGLIVVKGNEKNIEVIDDDYELQESEL